MELQPSKTASIRTQHGLSLIELMVAMAIGVVLTFGAVNLFLASKVSYIQDEEQARLQENGRYALRYLSRELSMSGFFGQVLRGELISTSLDGTDCYDYALDAEVAFEHHNNVDADGVSTLNDPNMPSDCLTAGEHVVGTDILTIRRTKDLPHYYQGTSNEAVAGTETYLEVVDGSVSTTFIEGGSASSGSTVDIWEYYPQVLFLRNFSTTGDGIPTLCRRRLSAKTMGDVQCLVEGVENLQVEFGLDEDGDLVADRFEAEPTSAELKTAVSAKLYVLVRSLNEVSGYENKRTYYLGTSTTIDKSASPDGFYRRLFQTTVLLRNSEAYKF